MALVLLTGPRCALILYLGLGCSAAGLPIEKLVSRARRVLASCHGFFVAKTPLTR